MDPPEQNRLQLNFRVEKTENDALEKNDEL